LLTIGVAVVLLGFGKNVKTMYTAANNALAHVAAVASGSDAAGAAGAGGSAGDGDAGSTGGSSGVAAGATPGDGTGDGSSNPGGVLVAPSPYRELAFHNRPVSVGKQPDLTSLRPRGAIRSLEIAGRSRLLLVVSSTYSPFATPVWLGFSSRPPQQASMRKTALESCVLPRSQGSRWCAGQVMPTRGAAISDAHAAWRWTTTCSIYGPSGVEPRPTVMSPACLSYSCSNLLDRPPGCSGSQTPAGFAGFSLARLDHKVDQIGQGFCRAIVGLCTSLQSLRDSREF
jgi:hypothetical protein